MSLGEFNDESEKQFIEAKNGLLQEYSSRRTSHAELIIGYTVALFGLLQVVHVSAIFESIVKVFLLWIGVWILFSLTMYALARYRFYSRYCQFIIQYGKDRPYDKDDFEESLRKNFPKKSEEEIERLKKLPLHMKIEETVAREVNKEKVFGVPVLWAIKGEFSDRTRNSLPFTAVRLIFPKRMRRWMRYVVIYSPWMMYTIIPSVLLLFLLS